MPFYEASYKYGVNQEHRVLPLLRKHFDRDIRMIDGRFSQHDFEDDLYTYEVKSRTNRMNAYYETLITSDKMSDIKKPLILVFNFTDALCYIEYNETQFEPYKKVLFGRVDRNDPPKIHTYIPIKDLTKIGDWNSL